MFFFARDASEGLRAHGESGYEWVHNITEKYHDDGGLTSNSIAEKYSKALVEGDFEVMSDLAAISIWWSIASNSAFILVTGFAILDALVVLTFRVAFFLGFLLLFGCFFNFGFISGNVNILAFMLIVVMVWKVRYLETQTRHEFVLAQKKIDELRSEEEKIQRKNEALEAKLKLTTEQLQLIETAEDEIVGDKISELDAWKLDIDQEVHEPVADDIVRFRIHGNNTPLGGLWPGFLSRYAGRP